MIEFGAENTTEGYGDLLDERVRAFIDRGESSRDGRVSHEPSTLRCARDAGRRASVHMELAPVERFVDDPPNRRSQQ